MIYYTNECVSCGMPCIGNLCPYHNVEHFKCDFCGNEDVKLYHYNDSQICEDCLLKEFVVVDGSDW